MMETMLIGVGSEYRSDDRIGILAARYLRNKLSGLEILEFSGDGTDLLFHFESKKNLIIVDSIELSGNHKPGELLVVDMNQVDLKADINCYSSHSFGLADATNTAKALFAFPENAFLIGVYSKFFDFGQNLSFDCNKTIADIENKVKQLINLFYKNSVKEV